MSQEQQVLSNGQSTDTAVSGQGGIAAGEESNLAGAPAENAQAGEAGVLDEGAPIVSQGSGGKDTGEGFEQSGGTNPEDEGARPENPTTEPSNRNDTDEDPASLSAGYKASHNNIVKSRMKLAKLSKQREKAAARMGASLEESCAWDAYLATLQRRDRRLNPLLKILSCNP